MLTQSEFTRRVGIAPTYLASIETGRRWRHLVIVCNVADIPGTSPADLVRGIEID
jgi:transcriptional regulator with XRE-family HTH domain